MLPAQTASLKQINDIVNGIVRYRDKLAVYFDDSDTLTVAQKAAVNTAITNAKTALDSLNTALQSL